STGRQEREYDDGTSPSKVRSRCLLGHARRVRIAAGPGGRSPWPLSLAGAGSTVRLSCLRGGLVDRVDAVGLRGPLTVQRVTGAALRPRLIRTGSRSVCVGGIAV